MRKVLIAPFIGLIYIYQYLISPLLPKGCRHYPSCSVYSIDALKMHGLIRGGMLAVNRISRCQPWGTSGFDPVPRFLFKNIHPWKLSHGKCRTYPSCNRLKKH